MKVICAEGGLFALECPSDEYCQSNKSLVFVDATDPDFQAYVASKLAEHNFDFSTDYPKVSEYLASGHRAMKDELVKLYMFQKQIA